MRRDQDREERARRAVEEQQRLAQRRAAELAIAAAQANARTAAVQARHEQLRLEQLTAQLAAATEATLQRLDEAGFPGSVMVTYPAQRRLLGVVKVDVQVREPGWVVERSDWKSDGWVPNGRNGRSYIALLASGQYYYYYEDTTNGALTDDKSEYTKEEGTYSIAEFVRKHSVVAERIPKKLSGLGSTAANPSTPEAPEAPSTFETPEDPSPIFRIPRAQLPNYPRYPQRFGSLPDITPPTEDS